MSDSLKKIKQFIDYKGLSVSAFEKATGLSNGSFASQLKNEKTIGVDKLENILKVFPELNANWVLTDSGHMLRYETDDDALTIDEPTERYILKTDRKLAGQKIPLYNTQAAAGINKTFSDAPNVLEYISIPNLPKCDGAIFITGDSMYPLLKSGDIVAYKIVKNILEGIFWGEMYLLSFLVDDEDFTTVKYIQKSEMGGEYVKLVSQNQHHQPKDIPVKNISALAMIKASIRFNSMN